MRSTLEETNNIITEAEGRISEVEDRIVEINEAEREKKIKRIIFISIYIYCFYFL